MSTLEELREFQRTLDSDPDYVGVAFFSGPCCEASDEAIARDALILLKGSKDAVDVTDEVL